MFLLLTNLESTIISLVMEDLNSVNFKEWSQFPGQKYQFWVLGLRDSHSRLCFPPLWCSEVLRNRTQWGRDRDAIHMSGMPGWHLHLSGDFSSLQRLELSRGAIVRVQTSILLWSCYWQWINRSLVTFSSCDWILAGERLFLKTWSLWEHKLLKTLCLRSCLVNDPIAWLPTFKGFLVNMF